MLVAIYSIYYIISLVCIWRTSFSECSLQSGYFCHLFIFLSGVISFRLTVDFNVQYKITYLFYHDHVDSHIFYPFSCCVQLPTRLARCVYSIGARIWGGELSNCGRGGRGNEDSRGGVPWIPGIESECLCLHRRNADKSRLQANSICLRSQLRFNE